MIIVRAGQQDARTVGELFDQYRQFYQKEPDAKLCETYIEDRIANGESVIYLAKQDDIGLGFVQLYPTFCSVQACKIYVLYDLFVAGSVRRAGVGEALMRKARQHVEENGGKRIDLRTSIDNTKAQALYEKLGYCVGGGHFLTYSLQL